METRVYLQYDDGSFFAGFTTYYVDNKPRKTPNFGNYYEAKSLPIEEARNLKRRSLVKIRLLVNESIVGVPKFKEVQ